MIAAIIKNQKKSIVVEILFGTAFSCNEIFNVFNLHLLEIKTKPVRL